MSDTTLKMVLLGDDKSASSALKGVAGEAEKTHGAFGKLATIAGGVFGGALLTEATAKVGDFLKESVKAAVAEQQDQKRLALALKNTTGATTEQVGAADELLSKMSEQSGVAKDKLEPAYQRLVQSTGSLSQGHKELALAMDISAGSGKSLDTVSAALNKANLGSVSGLSRLGVATKDASGKTLDLNTILQKAAQTFHGQAAAAANSYAGQMARLHVTVEEFQKKLGTVLIPVLTKVALWFTGKVVPALVQFGDRIGPIAQHVGTQLKPVLDAMGHVLADQIVPALKSSAEWIQKNSDWLVPLATTIAAMVAAWKAYIITVEIVKAVTVAWTAVQAALDVVLNANPIGLIVIALAGLVVGFKEAYDHSSKFRDAIHAIGDTAATVWRAVVDAFDHVKSAISTAFDWVKAHWPLILGIITGPFGLAVVEIATHWSEIKTAAGKVVDWFGNLGGKISNAVSGMWDGIKTGFASVINGVIDAWNSLHFSIPKIDVAGVKLGGGTIGVPPIPHVKLAEGGIVQARAGGTLALIGEAGKDEAVIPLDRLGKSHGAGSGGDTIHVTVNGFVGNESQLAREIEKVLTKTRRERGGAALAFQ